MVTPSFESRNWVKEARVLLHQEWKSDAALAYFGGQP